MNKQDILSRLDFRTFYKNHLSSLKENGKVEAMALCPFHDDHNPSLSVNLENGFYHCFGCGEGGNVFDFLMRLKRVDFGTAMVEIESMIGIEAVPGNGYGKVIATYPYTDTEGKILYIKERIEPGRNGKSKEFVFKHHANGCNKRDCKPIPHEPRWHYGRGHEPVPYNLPEIIEASKVFWVEGEGKVEALKKWHFVATSLDTGVDSPWREDYLSYFKGKEKIVILPDNDNSGNEYAHKVANTFYGKVKEIKMVKLPGLKESEDIIDWQKRGGTWGGFDIVEVTPVWNPQETEKFVSCPIDRNLSGNEFWRPIPISELDDLQDNITWAWEGYLVNGGMTLLSGLWKSGKTTLLCHLLKEMSIGGELARKKVRKGIVLVLSEENKGLWKRRRDTYSLDGGIDLICRPFKQKPKWNELVVERRMTLMATGVKNALLDKLMSICQETNCKGNPLEIPYERTTER